MSDSHTHLSRRERQIMNIIYELGESTAAEVQKRLPDPPSYSAVRAMLAKLENKGHLEHREDGPRYVFFATVPHEAAQTSALKQLVQTFFAGSTTKAVNALLGMSGEKLSKDELDNLAQAIDHARDEGR